MRHKMTKDARDELFEAFHKDYAGAGQTEKKEILNYIVRSTGFHRKYVIQRFAQHPKERLEGRKRHVVYGEPVRDAIIELWNATERLCSKRLVAAIPKFLPHLQARGIIPADTELSRQLRTISAATIDRMLASERAKNKGRGFSLTKPSVLLREQIRVRTFADGFPEGEPGWFEADCVAHCGSSPKGAFLNSLTMTDIATGWTEVICLLKKEDSAVAAALSNIRLKVPFCMKGLDTDNGCEFINYRIHDWCESSEVQFTRGREYKKNDQAHVEEKNGSVVRRFVGYDRFEGQAAQLQMNALYDQLRLFRNYFLPSLKLAHKHRENGRPRRVYRAAATPADRLLACDIPEVQKQRIRDEAAKLDPIALREQIIALQTRLFQLAVFPEPHRIAFDSLTKVLEQGDETQQTENHRENIRQRRRHARAASPATTPGVPVERQVCAFVRTLKEGDQFSAAQLSHIGQRGTINAAVRKLIRKGHLERTKVGHYQVAAKLPDPAVNVAQKVREFVENAPEPITNDQMRHLGDRKLVNAELRQCVKRKSIRRIAVGKYRRIHNAK